MIGVRLLALAGLVLAAQFAACGSSSSLADAAPCPPTTPLPTSAAAPRITQGRTYFLVVQDRVSRLQDLWTGFKLAYPSNSFVRDATFRPGVAKFVDDSTCLAREIQELQAPSAQLEQSKAQLDAALAAYAAHLKTGRDAVRSRNVTDYHAFWDGLDAKFEAVRAAFSRR